MQPQLTVFTSFEEAGWGLLLIALTMVVHGIGVTVALRVNNRMRHRIHGTPNYFHGLALLVAATWMLVVVHLFEVVAIWSLFLWWHGAFKTMRDCVYYTLMQYTTVGSDLSLPRHLRLLGGMIAMSGLLTFAWTTGVLFTMAQALESQGSRNRRPDAP
jgi:hypothetical protein